MTRGLPHGVAVVCTLCSLWGLAGRARAGERRQVAIVDLSGDPAAKALGAAIYDQLQIHWALRALGDPLLDAALEGKLLDEDSTWLLQARDDQAAALDALTQFQDALAVTRAKDGEQALANATPTAAVPLLGDLSFSLGLAELGLHHPNEANLAFALTYRLDPMRQIDPTRYELAVVDAYGKAKETKPARCKLTITGVGRVWIDGVEVGAAPGVFPTEAGHHLVQLTSPDRPTVGRAIAITGDTELPIKVPQVDKVLAIQRARLALARAPDDAVARAGPMKHLAALLGVHDAVLIWKRGDGRLQTQTWRDHAPGFSAPRVHGDEKPVDVLAPLSPPRPPEPPHLVGPDPFKVPPIEHHAAWYQKRWVQASLAGGIVAAIVGAVLWSQRTTYIPTPPGGIPVEYGGP